MAVSKIWVFAEADGDKPTSATLEILTKARELADTVEAPLPAVVSVTAGVVEPRYPSFKGIMAAKNKPVDTVTVADLGLDAGEVGWAGARQSIVSVGAAPERQAGEKVEDDGEAFQRIVAYLEQLKVI